MTGGRVKVAHFTGKARVDAVVEAAGFPRHTFVHAPMYFQNFLTMNDAHSRCRTAVVAGRSRWTPRRASCTPAMSPKWAAWWPPPSRAGDKLPSGSYLAVCGGVYSWNDFVATLNAQGHDLQVTRVPPEAYDSFYPGAREIREMYQYYEQHTYFGPEGEKRIAAASGLVPDGFTGFADWAKVHMKPT